MRLSFRSTLAAVAVMAVPGCSPYLYNGEIASFSDSIEKVRTFEQSMATALPVAKDAQIRTQARLSGRVLGLSSDCEPPTSTQKNDLDSAACQPVVSDPNGLLPAPSKTAAADTRAQAQDAVRQQANVIPAGPGFAENEQLDRPGPRWCDALPRTPVTTNDAKKAKKQDIQPEDMLAALDRYAKALRAITNAKDRAEFDAASMALATTTAALAGMVAGPMGAGGLAVTTAVIELARYGVAVSLDERRFHTLRCVVVRSEPTVKILTILIGFYLGQQATVLGGALQNEGDFLYRSALMRRDPDAREADMARLQAVAADLRTVRASRARAAAEAIGDAHDKLAEALASDDRRQAMSVAQVIGDLVQKTSALQPVSAP